MESSKFFYSNAVIVGYSGWDVTFSLQRRGLTANASTTSGPVDSEIQDRLDVVMSPSHALLFALHALRAVKDYQEKIGPISLPAAEKAAVEKLRADLGLPA
jgi:hypothetical protein